MNYLLYPPGDDINLSQNYLKGIDVTELFCHAFLFLLYLTPNTEE